MTQNTNGSTRLELLGLLMKHDRGSSPNFQVFDHICFSIWYLFFYYQFFVYVKLNFHSFIPNLWTVIMGIKSLIYLSAVVCLKLPCHLFFKVDLLYILTSVGYKNWKKKTKRERESSLEVSQSASSWDSYSSHFLIKVQGRLFMMDCKFPNVLGGQYLHWGYCVPPPRRMFAKPSHY